MISNVWFCKTNHKIINHLKSILFALGTDGHFSTCPIDKGKNHQNSYKRHGKQGQIKGYWSNINGWIQTFLPWFDTSISK